MQNDLYSFYELMQAYEVKVPIIQRDYAQGRKNNIGLCENFLEALKESILSNKTINLDFIYGNVEDKVFPLTVKVGSVLQRFSCSTGMPM